MNRTKWLWQVGKFAKIWWNGHNHMLLSLWLSQVSAIFGPYDRKSITYAPPVRMACGRGRDDAHVGNQPGKMQCSNPLGCSTDGEHIRSLWFCQRSDSLSCVQSEWHRLGVDFHSRNNFSCKLSQSRAQFSRWVAALFLLPPEWFSDSAPVRLSLSQFLTCIYWQNALKFAGNVTSSSERFVRNLSYK